jgi:hypothetical protein
VRPVLGELDVDAPVGRIIEGGSMTKRKIAGWIMLSVVAACWSDAPPSVTPPLERTDPSTRVQDVVEAETVAFGLDLECEGFPWRVYSTMPLMYQPPCSFGEMVRADRARRTPAEELEEARAENTALHERLREMAEYAAFVEERLQRLGRGRSTGSRG